LRASQGRPAAFLDVDELSRLWPTRDGDPFNTGLILRNLASIVEERLRQRHQGAELDGLAWHIDRAPELVAIQDRELQLPVGVASEVSGSFRSSMTRSRQRDQAYSGDTTELSCPPARRARGRVSASMPSGFPGTSAGHVM